MSHVLITGGKGTLGGQVVSRLVDAGHIVRVATRSPRARSDLAVDVGLDLSTGAGIEDALDGIDVVVHAATDAIHAEQVDVAGTATLVRAAREAGVEHLIYPSIVGIDAHAFAYYRAKRAAEEIIEKGGVPFTIQRITQFHQFPARLADAQRRMPIVVAPSNIEFQVLDVSVAAVRIVELVGAPPAGRAQDLGGARPIRVDELMRTYLRSRGSHRPVVRVRFPGAAGRDFRAGLQLSDDHSGARPTWEEFLEGVSARRTTVRS